MKIYSEQEMLDFGRKLAATLTTPAVIELIGDVGAGKTTLVRGLAEGLKIHEKVTSPSFTISKTYAFPVEKETHFLIHYDFYRLNDPGLMLDDLNEAINNSKAITVIEWGESVAGILPENRKIIKIFYNDDGTRGVEI